MIHLSQSIADIKELIKTLAYLDKVVPTEKSISALDKNTLYEIVYAHVKLENILSGDSIEDSLVETEVKDLHSRLGMMIDLIPEKTVNEALESDLYKSMAQIDKLKYSKGAGFDGTIEKSYKRVTEPFCQYISAKIVSILVAFIILFIIMTGKASNIGSGIASVMLDLAGKAGSEATNPNILAITNITNVLIGIMMIFAMGSMVGIMVDLMYISLPMMRGVLGDLAARLISPDARNAVNTEFNEEIQFTKVREPDRIARNLSMYGVLKKNHPDNAGLALIAEDMQRGRGKKYLYALAKVEYLYDKLECA